MPFHREQNSRSSKPRRQARQRFPSVEPLEARALLTGTAWIDASPDIVMLSATTADSKGVTIDYRIDNASIQGAIPIRVERSVDSQQHDTDLIVGTVSIAAGMLDDHGQAANAVGEHTLTLAVPGGLPPTPELPYVVVTANPDHSIVESNTTNDTAAFHKYTVAVISHGGLQPSSWKALGPPWERHLANRLRDQGFDQVIAFNWVGESSTPGSAAKQAPKLERIINKDVNALSTTDPVDIQFIGHSEGTVVNSQTILRLNKDGWPQAAKAGYLKVTMLDPHAANNGIHGQQYSVSNNLLGWIAREVINDYQARADDPPVVVPPNVDSAEVFYERTPAEKAFGSNDGVYNLWGQVPVHGGATYYNLTATGISHSGKFSVQDWYALNVAPTLGIGAPSIESQALTASQVGSPASALARPRRDPDAGPKTVEYQGTAAPNTRIQVFAGRVGRNARAGDLVRVGLTSTDAEGNWQVTTRAITAGHYRMVFQADSMISSIGRRSPLKPTAWLPPIKL